MIYFVILELRSFYALYIAAALIYSYRGGDKINIKVNKVKTDIIKFKTDITEFKINIIEIKIKIKLLKNYFKN